MLGHVNTRAVAGSAARGPSITRSLVATVTTFGREDVAPSIAPWVVGRAIVLTGLALARYLFDHVGSGARPVALRQGLFAWDASFYESIARFGYGSVGRAGLRFFPLFPIASRGFGTVFLGRADIAMIVLVNACALVFMGCLHRLVREETGDVRLARRSVWFSALLPPAICLVIGYAEALLLLFAVSAFLAMRARRWEWVAVFGLLAGLCRPVGLLLALPVAIEVVLTWRVTPVRRRIGAVAAGVSPVVGVGIFLAWVGATRGDALLPLRVQQNPTLRGGFEDPISALVDAAHRSVGGVLHVVWAVIFIVLLVAIARRLPVTYTAYAAAALAVGLTAHNLDSFERYGLSTFPFIIGAALVTERRELANIALTLSAAALLGYSTLVFLGLSVP
jgi:hypothetical protein